MGAHVVPEREMPPYIPPVVCLEDMDLMRPLIPAFAEIPPPCYPELPAIFITCFSELFRRPIRLFKAPDHSQNIDNRLCRQARYRCTSYVIDRDAVIRKNIPDQ